MSWISGFGLKRTPERRPSGSTLVGAVVAAMAIALSACGDSQDKEAGYLERGKALLANADRVKATIEFKNALQINPRSADALYHLALISEAEGDLRAAFGAFYVRTGRSPEAEELLRDGIAMAPDSWPMKALLIGYLKTHGAPGAASRELKAPQAADPGNAEYAFILAEHYEAAGEFAEAEDFDGASALIGEVLADDPEHAQALLTRAAIFVENGGLMNAVTDLRTVVDTIAWLAFRAGDAETADKLLDGIGQVDHPEIRYHRGAVLMALGKNERARQELAAALETGAPFAGRDNAARLLSGGAGR